MHVERYLRVVLGLVLVAVFAAGTLFGAGLMRWARVGPPPPPPDPIESIRSELGLDADQVATLRGIAQAHRGELEAIAREAQPRVRAVLFSIEDELRPHLRADQSARLDAWRARRGPLPPPPMP